MEEERVEKVERADAAPEFAMDERTTKGFNAWFRSLPTDAARPTVRFFDRKGFYTVHGDDALYVARTFYKTTAVVKYYGAEGGKVKDGSSDGSLPSVSLNSNLFSTALKELLLEGSEHCVEVYEGTGASWRLIKSASPGRLHQLEDELFRGAGDGGADMPLVMAVTLSMVEGQRQIGLAYVDMSGRRLGACQFFDDEQLCSLETAIVQLGGRECVVAADGGGGGAAAAAAAEAGEKAGVGQALAGADARRLADVLSRCNIMSTARPKSAFSAKHLESDLAKLLKSGSVERHSDVTERPAACAALAAAIAFSELLSDPGSHRKFDLALYDQGRYMRLDSAAQRALNVHPSRGDGQRTTFSLLGLLSRCRTPMGKRKLKVWLKQPLVRVDDITARHDVVDALVEDAELRERLRDTHLRGMPDVERLSRRLEAQKLGLPELCQLYRASAVLPLIEDALRQHTGPHADKLVARYADVLATAHDGEHLTKFEELLEAAIDLERIPEEYLICASYDPRLDDLKASKEGIESEVDSIAHTAARDLGLELGKTIKLEWHKYANTRARCLRITQKEEKIVRAKLNSRYKTIEARKDGTKFTNRELEKAAERLSAVSGQYEELQRELVEQVVSVAHTFVEVWEGVAGLLAELDVLLGFADLAVCAPSRYVRPTMLPAESGELTLVGSRHPCVEAQESVEFIKNDCRLVRGESWFQIITGPNMGGKSTFIRQVGVCVLLAQIGCFVPADEARISVRDAIFARVGAGDCQQRGVSTFMAEMLETAAILKGATERSLVIIDELGRGTSTYDGFGLAWAISERIMESVGAPALFATHFHELTELTGPGGVRNLHVAAAVDSSSRKLTMLYQIRDGPCDQSFGIQVAESANFPASVVADAKAKLAQLEAGESALRGATAAAAAAATAGTKRAREEDGDAATAFLRAVAALDVEALGTAAAAEHARALLERYESARGGGGDKPVAKRVEVGASA
ncbi:hypothetical protein FOA52_006916 [Chlamydomonas sp. UWO 241]|nr:hypothetical protein FOA52_006916 [Chlamydomonas sp. UWO 241]